MQVLSSYIVEEIKKSIFMITSILLRPAADSLTILTTEAAAPPGRC